MENTSKSNLNLDMIAWGIFFIFWAVSAMIPSLPDGTGAVGFGLILLGLNLARALQGQPTSRFTIMLGSLALLLGTFQLARPILHITFELPIFAILLFALGLITLTDALKK